MNTSISDNSTYNEICEMAAKNDATFSKFKSIPRYTDILEHVTQEEGLAYYNMFRHDTDIIDKLSQFTINDRIGNPQTYNYHFGRYSPTTLRYIKILKDLKDTYLTLDDTNIIEIGVGYGGQYVTLRQLFRPKLYTFVDLPNTIELTKKYIKTLSISTEVPTLDLTYQTQYLDCTANNDYKEYDLVISNYSFSECIREIQDNYINILVNSKHGYLLYNNLRGYSAKELVDVLSKRGKAIEIHNEEPRTSPNNVLLKW